MNLISCDNCGVVLDYKKLNFAEDIYGSDDEVDQSKAAWCSSRREFVPFVPCPVCESQILAD